MADLPPIDYAPAPPAPAPKKVPTILWWFLVDLAIYFGALAYAASEYEGLGPFQELPPAKLAILDCWFFVALGLFVFLLGWAAWRWWRLRGGRAKAT